MRQLLGNWVAVATLMVAILPDAVHASEPQTIGTISVEARPVEPDLSASLPTFVQMVGRTLAEKGFTTIEGSGHARFVADLSVTRVQIGTTTAKVPVTGSEILKGGSSSRVGGGIEVALPTSKVKTLPLQRTRLEIRIRRRGEENVIWHGAALTVRAAGQEADVSSALAEAVFRTYPEESEGVVTIP